MKVPAYQNQVGYQAANAQAVTVATPLAEASRNKDWTDVAAAGHIMRGIAQVKNTWGQLKNPSTGQKQKQSSADNDPAKFSGFSSPERGNLLAFGRQEAFQSANTQAGGALTAVEKLDDFFGRQARQLALTPQQADSHLLAQDYAIIRREVGRVHCITSALSYFDGYRADRLPQNLLQAQRDYFGAHTYERVDKPRGEFFHTNWTGHGGNTTANTYIA